MSINLPPELLASLTTAAELAGISVEEFVVKTLKANVPPMAENNGKPIPANGGPTMYDKLKKYIGSIDGPAESYSDERLAEMIEEDIQRERK